MFLHEYYFSNSKFASAFRVIGGPVIFLFGLDLCNGSSNGLAIAYGGFMFAFSIYYSFKPFWWVLSKWQHFNTIEFQIEATSDKVLIKEDKSDSQTEYTEFKRIVKRKNYIVLIVHKGLKFYLPINKLTQETIDTLTQFEIQPT